MTVLYADAGGRSNGDIWIGVCDSAGVLIDSDVMHDTLINLAEMGAVLLACDHARIGEPGVILTDSLTAVKSMGRDWGLHKLTTRMDEYMALRDAIHRKLPGGWQVAWIPRVRNLADAALEQHIREKEGIAP